MLLMYLLFKVDIIFFVVFESFDASSPFNIIFIYITIFISTYGWITHHMEALDCRNVCVFLVYFGLNLH